MNLCAALPQASASRSSLAAIPETPNMLKTIFQAILSPKYFHTLNSRLDEPRLLDNKAVTQIQEKYGLLEAMAAAFSAIDQRQSAFRKGLSPIESGIISTCKEDLIKGACELFFCPLTLHSCPEQLKDAAMRRAIFDESSTVCFLLGYKFTDTENEIAVCLGQTDVLEVPIKPARLAEC